MEFRQADNDGGHYDVGGHHGRGVLQPRRMLTCTLTSSDQWSNLKNNWNFVLESCI